MKKVLIVDDSQDILELVAWILQHNGFNVCTNSTGENVYEVVLSYEPDIILLDIHLPGKSGIEICKEIKQSLNLPIVLFSAQANKIKSLEESRADAFIEKPFQVNTLIDTINFHINQRA